MKSFTNSVVIITGASRGIGKELASIFLENGARVAICGKDSIRLAVAQQELLKVCQSSEQLLCLPVDVADLKQGKDFIDKVLKQFGRIDILINNAAVGMFQDIADVAITDVTKLFETNFLAPLTFIQATLPTMRTQKSGYIINLSSVISKHSVFHQGIYAASKSALDRLTESIRAEEGSHGIKTMTVWPDRTRTDFRKHVIGPKDQARLQQNLKENDPAVIARRIFHAIAKGKHQFYTSIMARIYGLLSFFAPFVVRHVMRKK